MIKNFPKAILYLIAFTLLPGFLSAASPEEGKKLFVDKLCASCHDKALGGVQERWADYPLEDLYAWIRNSQKLIASGHPRAIEVWTEYNKVQMTSMESLTDDEIASILLYINGTADGTFGPAPSSTALTGEEVGVAASSTPKWLYFGLFGLLAFLALLLSRIISNLNVIAAKKEGRPYERKTLMQTLTSKGVIGFEVTQL